MLHAVQKEAIRRSWLKPGFGFLMQQGLGKTLTVLAEFNELVKEGKATRLVVLCPNSFKGGWVKEMKKWGFEFDPLVFESGSDYSWWLKKSFKAPPVLIVNYEAIRSKSTMEFIESFIKDRSAMIAADESIQLKTHDSAQTKAAILLAYNFEYRRVLSGKWMTQGPHDIWAQMRFMGQLSGTNYFAFRHTYCKMGGFKAKQVVGAKNEERLAKLVEPVVFQALKVDWTDLPPKIYTTRTYNLHKDVKAHYDSMFHDFVAWLETGEAVAVDAAITKYIKLAQIQCGFLIDEFGTTHQIVPDSSNARLKLLQQILEEEVYGKVAICYNNKAVFDQLSAALAHLNPAYIKGQMATDEVEFQKQRFNEDPSCRVILLQTAASKYGHTLLGGNEPVNRCSTMIFYQNTYALDDRSQIEDRIHRHGQTADSVLYIDLAGTSLDEAMVEALQRKESVYRVIMGAVSGGASLRSP